MVTLRHIGMRKVVVREAVREGRLVSEWCQRVSAIGRSGVPNVECRRNHRGKGLVEILTSGSMNHVRFTVSDIPHAESFYDPLLGYMGYELA
jgi:hypothetical protein